MWHAWLVRLWALWPSEDVGSGLVLVLKSGVGVVLREVDWEGYTHAVPSTPGGLW